jgi:hypothetical protein
MIFVSIFSLLFVFDNAKVISVLRGRMAFQVACSDIIRIVPHCSDLLCSAHRKAQKKAPEPLFVLMLTQ